MSSRDPGQTRCGIAYADRNEPWNGQGHRAYLPLQKLDVHAEIIEASSIITLTQTFTSSSKIWGERPYAHYVFPLPDNAVVCEFEMRSKDGREIIAIAKETGKARATFTKAYNANRPAGLTEYVAENIFSISLGNLPESEVITTKLTYATDLSSVEHRDQVRLHIPTCFGAQYGQGLGDEIPAYRIGFTANIRMRGPIQSVTSPTHPHLVTTFASSPDEQLPAYDHEPQCTTSYRSEQYLATDFTLIITSTHLSEPLCVAERHPSGSIAFRLSAIPDLKLPPIARQEYIFLLDCSASMYGNRLATAIKTLVLLLHALPSTGTMFNIYSFGSWHKKLWTESQEYTQESLTEACEYVDQMIADHGGTDICSVLRAACASRNRNYPTACFLLTDGEVLGDPAQTLQTVANEVERSTVLQPLRVFTLGIGEQASVSMCEAIARTGNGVSLMATATDDMVSKCARLVRLSRSPVCEVSVDWMVPQGRSRALLPCCARRLALRVQPGELKSPIDGMQFTHYTLINKKRYVVPKEVILSIRIMGKEDTTRIIVPVEELPSIREQTSGQRSQFHLIHALTVNSVIRRLEAEDKGVGHYKSQIVSLAKKYGLISRYTSLVAVEKEKKTPVEFRLPTRDSNIRAYRMFPTFSLPSFSDTQAVRRPPRSRRTTSSWSSTLVPKGNGKGKSRGNSTIDEKSRGQDPPEAEKKQPQQEENEIDMDPSILYGQEEYPSPKSARREAYVDGSNAREHFVCEYDPTVESVGNYDSGCQEEYGVRSARPHVPPTRPANATLRKQSVLLLHKPPEGGSGWKDSWQTHIKTVRGSLNFKPTSTSTSAAAAGSSSTDGVDNSTMQLIRLQAFDGSFSATPELEKIVGRIAMNEHLKFPENLRVSEEVWATVLALAYLQKYLTQQSDLLNALEDKAMTYLRTQDGGVSIPTLLERANLLLA
ncbi:von Willebrand factor type A domain-containing protein [Irpex rosettiformis]|uniref:von Willebrand factor type A domain-containing protein n=1 Tax=Irpex rosettiformis TaxID=378272 RepID=A0ACB8U5L2_9APHY|nr:von Willebrand factor type A domain-containing protein [Irpex rosettiformis]